MACHALTTVGHIPCPYDDWSCHALTNAEINNHPLSLHDATIELRIKNTLDTNRFSARNIKRQKYP